MSNIEDPLVAFGAALRAARNARGCTVEELAAKTGVSKSAIDAFEIGDAEATLLDVVALAKGLGTTPQELFAGARL